VGAGCIAILAGLVLAGILFASCATTARPLPALAPEMDVEVLAPSVLGDVDLAKLPRYPDVVVDGKANACDLPTGMLLSPRSYAESILVENERRRLLTENTVLRNLRGEERRASSDLQRAATAVANEEARGRTLRPWLIAGSFILGVLAGGWVARQ